MPFSELNIVPSVNIETTSADNPSGIEESQFVRWKGNLIEKRGGCTLFVETQLEGIPKDLQPWADLNGTSRVGIATDKQVYAYIADPNVPAPDNLPIISPKYITRDKVPIQLSVNQNESVIKVYDASIRNITIYDSVTFNVPVSVGGIFLYGTYQVAETYGAHSYLIATRSPALETVRNGGSVPLFTTSSGSTEVKVTFPIAYQTAQLQVGNTIGFEVPTDVGGLTMLGQYKVARIIDDRNFILVDNQVATSSESKYLNGDSTSGNLSLTYWITEGPTLSGTGYGSNPYGGNGSPDFPVPPNTPIGYGQGQNIDPQTGTTFSADNWYLDNRGPTLVACAVDGPIFLWDESTGYKNLAILPGSPIRNKGAFQSMPYGNIMAWGCSDSLDPLQQPLFIRWSSSKDPTVWTPALDNDAGFITIPTGSKVVGGIQAPAQQYWFTDVDVYVAQYVGYSNWYQFNKIGNGCGLIAPKAVGLLNGNVYWMSQKQFFVSAGGGAPQPIPCSVWDFIFQNINQNDLDKVICATNSLFNEVSWYFPSITKPDGQPQQSPDQYPTAYVCYNSQYNEWDVGYLNRTSWFDQSLVGPPIAADENGWVYQHETSNNLAVGKTTQPIYSWFKTGYFSINAGQDLSFVDWVLPDFTWGQYSQQPKAAEMQFTFYVTDYAGQQPRVYGPYNCNSETPFLTPRIRGRYWSVKIDSNDLDSFWRIGSIRYRFAPSGRR